MPRQAKCLPCWDRRDAGQPTPAQIGETLPAEQCTPSATGSGGPVAAYLLQPPPLHHPSPSPSLLVTAHHEAVKLPHCFPISPFQMWISGWRRRACWTTARGTCEWSTTLKWARPRAPSPPVSSMTLSQQLLGVPLRAAGRLGLLLHAVRNHHCWMGSTTVALLC